MPAYNAPHAFTAAAAQKLIDAVRRLEDEVRNLKLSLARTQRDHEGRQIHLAKTAAKTGETYPAAGCVLPFRFLDRTFDETTGACPATTDIEWDEGLDRIGRTFSGEHLDEDEYVLALRMPSREGLRWWLMPASMGTEIIRGTLAADMCGAAVGINSATTIPGGTSLGSLAAGSVDNPHNHRGPSGAKVVAVKDDAGKYRIIDVEMDDLCVVAGLDDSAQCVRFWTIKHAAEWCPANEPTTKQKLFDWYDCDGAVGTCTLTLTFDEEGSC